jgi:hypothetical protein
LKLNGRLLAGLLMATLSACTTAQVSRNIIERLHQAEIEDSIDGPEMKPWHLKISFQLFGAMGDQTDQGTIEEWWDHTHQRIIVTSTGYSATLLKMTQAVSSPPAPMRCPIHLSPWCVA